MSSKRVAGRYAKSLLGLSIEQNSLEDVLKDMSTLREMSKNRDLANLMKSPIVNVDKKKAVFSALFDKSFSKISKAFVTLVLNKGRESMLPEIAAEFVEQYNDYKGITKVEITTASPLDTGSFDQVKAKLTASAHTAQQLEIVTKVDPSIIGGMIIKIGDKLIDDSVAFKLKKLTKDFDNKDYIKAF
jgi:F-type H+-transporting ATPase subunit delta